MTSMDSSPTPDGARSESSMRRAWQSRLVQWALLSLLWLTLAVISAAQNVAWREIDWKIALGFTLLDWGPWIILSPLVLWFARRVQIDGRNWRRTVPLHIAGALLTGVLSHLIAQVAIEYRLVPIPEGGFFFRIVERRLDDRPPPPEKRRAIVREYREPREGPPPTIPRFIRARFSIPIYCVLVAAAHAVSYHRRSLERERRALAAEARLAEARLMALQTQLNPHFLFNTLNAVSSLVYTQPQAADEMICALSELLRRVLALADRREVTLAEELEFVDRYLQIQRIRFADRLEVRREIAPGLDRSLVPTLILQPLVENAIIHGIAPRAARGAVTLRARAVGDRLVLEVSDTGCAEPAPGGAPAGGAAPVKERVGLGNTRARLAAMFGAEAHFTLTAAPEGGMCARIDLPLRQTVTA